MGFAGKNMLVSGATRQLFLSSSRQGTQAQWRVVFFISAAIYIFGWLSYVTVVKGHVLPWAKTPEALDIVTKEASAINAMHNTCT